MMLPKIQTAPIVAFTFMIAAAAFCCQVPVFRYALERWEPAPYLLTIMPGQSGLSAGEEAIVDSLQNPDVPVNLEIEVMAASASSPQTAMVLHYPQKRRDDARQAILRAGLTKDDALSLIDSPIRVELRQRLLAGQSAIWLLLESGDSAKDDAAAKTLLESLEAAQEKLQLPDGVITQDQAAEPSGAKARENADVLQSDLPLRIEFSLLRLNRQDSAEAAFISMLMHMEEDLTDYEQEPMAFPIFGRGRALEPLIGAGIHLDNILEAAGYLCGACSCEIKDQNPGMDLLLAADWRSVDNAPKIETVRIEPSLSSAPERSPTKAIPIVGAIALLLGVAFVFRRSAMK